MQPAVSNKFKTLMGFDFGTKRIGFAMGQRITHSANGVGCFAAKDGRPNWDELDKLVAEWQPDGFVVGLPINMDGSTSQMSLRANKFSNRISARYGKASFTIDERLSTFAAKQEARARGHKGHYKSDPVDALAAQIILQTWLDENPLIDTQKSD